MFLSFKNSFDSSIVPDSFQLMKDNSPHELCLLAVQELQGYLQEQESWSHNFGLDTQRKSPIIGKMFGVLVVETSSEDVGYLAAFSGKLGGTNLHHGFVPPVFDFLTEGSFLNLGMQELRRMTDYIKLLEKDPVDIALLTLHKRIRRDHSIALQQEIFERYHLINQNGIEKSLNQVFKDAGYKSPPAGAGECAGIKLLQYAFRRQMKPLALTEFWWGKSPKSATWKHGEFYSCCKEKCEPILIHMLS